MAEELTAAAFDLFTARGFEAVTVADISTSAGISARSFFRYFASKEEVLLQSVDAAGEQLARALAERPRAEEPWEALRRCFDPLVANVERDPQRAAALLRMMLSSPALHSSHLGKQARWRGLLVDVLSTRAPRPPGHDQGAAPAPGTSRPSMMASTALSQASLAGAALACLEAAQLAWVQARTDGLGGVASADLAPLIDQAMDAVHPLPR